jgi:hypothetical protein
MPTKDPRITVRLKPDLHAEVEARAQREKRTLANMLEVIVSEARPPHGWGVGRSGNDGTVFKKR